MIGTGPHSRRWAAGEWAKLHLPLPIVRTIAWTVTSHPSPWSVEKLSSTKPVPSAKMLGTADLSNVLSLLKVLCRFSVVFRIESKLLPVAVEAQCHLTQASSARFLSLIFFCLLYSLTLTDWFIYSFDRYFLRTSYVFGTVLYIIKYHLEQMQQSLSPNGIDNLGRGSDNKQSKVC